MRNLPELRWVSFFYGKILARLIFPIFEPLRKKKEKYDDFWKKC